MMQTFDYVYQSFKTRYIYNNSLAKFISVDTRIYDSDKLRKLNIISFSRKIAPSSKDFGATIQSIGYFIIANSDTSAMAQLTAIKRWNEEVNQHLNLCTEYELYCKAESTLSQWSKNL